MREMFADPKSDLADQQASDERLCGGFSITGSDRFVIVNITAHTVHLDAETLRALSPLDSPPPTSTVREAT